MKTLKDVKVGETATVAKLHGEGPVKRRIMDMGITKGVEIYVRKVAPLGDPMELTVRGYELGRVKSIRQGHCTEIYARKTRLGRNRRIDELKRPISSSLTSLITIKQIDDTRFRMMGKKSNVLTSKRGA